MPGYGVPTTGQNGVRFRSRLEARWAAFFTLMGWPWQYEPDLDGNGWIPDFLIPSGAGLLVEVKPVSTIEGFAEHYPRIEKSGLVAPVWLVGAALFYTTGQDLAIGMFRPTGAPSSGERYASPEGYWRPAMLAEIVKNVGVTETRTVKDAVRLWQQRWVRASNAVQWKKR